MSRRCPMLMHWFNNKRTPYFIAFGLFILIPLAFALYTDHAWEDYYITYRASKNLATGHGLVFTPGERLHTFTSPINVLLPAFFSAATGNTSDTLVLWLYRLSGILAFAGAGLLLLRIAEEFRISRFAAFLLLGLFATNSKIIDFTINGQEIGFMVLFIALVLYALSVHTPRPWLVLGAAWAGLMYTRPDGFIYGGGIALGFLIAGPVESIAKNRIELLKLFGAAAAATTFLYLPWFAWAWLYYGSPVPYTAVARGVGVEIFKPLHILGKLLLFPVTSLGGSQPLDAAFMPPYAVPFGGWPGFGYVTSKIVSWLSMMYWVYPMGNRVTRAASFGLLLGFFYLSEIVPQWQTWYIPSCSLLALFVFALISSDAIEYISSKSRSESRYLSILLRVGTALFLFLNAALLTAAAYQLRLQQRIIEGSHRKQVGLWLRQNARTPNDTVFLEPLGYIGYFSGLKMLDFPGLSSAEIVTARKRLQSDSWAKLITFVKPDWLVLRPWEAKNIQRQDPSLLGTIYMQKKVFDVSRAVASYKVLPGRRYFLVDQTFLVFKRAGR